jgi:hypothetical protein
MGVHFNRANRSSLRRRQTLHNVEEALKRGERECREVKGEETGFCVDLAVCKEDT